MHINVKEDKSDFAAYVRNVVRQADCPQGSEVSLSTQGIWTCSAGSMPPIAQVLHSNLTRRPIISSWEKTWLIPIHLLNFEPEWLRQDALQDESDSSFRHSPSLCGASFSCEPRQGASFGGCHSICSNHCCLAMSFKVQLFQLLLRKSSKLSV